MLLMAAVVVELAACGRKQAPPPAPAQSPAFVKQYQRQMKSAKTDVEAAQKKEEVRDDKLLEEAK